MRKSMTVWLVALNSAPSKEEEALVEHLSSERNSRLFLQEFKDHCETKGPSEWLIKSMIDLANKPKTNYYSTFIEEIIAILSRGGCTIQNRQELFTEACRIKASMDFRCRPITTLNCITDRAKQSMSEIPELADKALEPWHSYVQAVQDLMKRMPNDDRVENIGEEYLKEIELGISEIISDFEKLIAIHYLRPSVIGPAFDKMRKMFDRPYVLDVEMLGDRFVGLLKRIKFIFDLQPILCDQKLVSINFDLFDNSNFFQNPFVIREKISRIKSKMGEYWEIYYNAVGAKEGDSVAEEAAKCRLNDFEEQLKQIERGLILERIILRPSTIALIAVIGYIAGYLSN